MGFLPSPGKSHRNARGSTVEHTIISKSPNSPSTKDYEGVQPLSCITADCQSRIVPPGIKGRIVRLWSKCCKANTTICRSSNLNCLANTHPIYWAFCVHAPTLKANYYFALVFSTLLVCPYLCKLKIDFVQLFLSH